jgi:hypothetical protein
MPIDRTAFNALLDDDGSGTTGSVWNKAAIDSVLLDPMDAAIVGQATVSGTPAAQQLALFSDADTITGDAALTYDATALEGLRLTRTEPRLILGYTGSTSKSRLHMAVPDWVALSQNARYDSVNGWQLDNAANYGMTFALSTGPVQTRATVNVLEMNGSETPLLEVQRHTVDPNQDKAVILPQGRLKFASTQNPSTDAYTLDDYREVNWTPAFGGTGGYSGQTYLFQTGKAVKIGRQVTAMFALVLTNKGTITGNLQLLGLPFVTDPEFSDCAIATCLRWANFAVAWSHLTIQMDGNAQSTNIRGNNGPSVNSLSSVTASDLTNNSELRGVLTYLAKD